MFIVFSCQMYFFLADLHYLCLFVGLLRFFGNVTSHALEKNSEICSVISLTESLLCSSESNKEESALT